MILLMGAYTGMSAKELALLTAEEASRLADTPIFKPVRDQVLDYIQALPPQNKGLMFRSQTYGGKLDRTTLFRIISAAKAGQGYPPGGVRILQMLHEQLQNT